MMINVGKQLEPDSSHTGAHFSLCVAAHIPPGTLGLLSSRLNCECPGTPNKTLSLKISTKLSSGDLEKGGLAMYL